MPNGHICLALLCISSDSKCCAKAVSVEYRHNPFILFHVSWISFFIYILLCSWLHLCLGFPLFSELLVKLAGERSLRPAPKRFPPLGRLANGIEKTAKESTIHNNNTAERTKYDQSTIMTRFTRKSNSTDVTRFSSPYLCSRVVLNSGHPVQRSKFGACAVTGYCSFNCSVCLTISLRPIWGGGHVFEPIIRNQLLVVGGDKLGPIIGDVAIRYPESCAFVSSTTTLSLSSRCSGKVPFPFRR